MIMALRTEGQGRRSVMGQANAVGLSSIEECFNFHCNSKLQTNVLFSCVFVIALLQNNRLSTDLNVSCINGCHNTAMIVVLAS